MHDTVIKDSCAYIKTWLDYLFPLMNVPGLSVAIAHQGKTIFSDTWGLSNNETPEPLQTDHLFRVASHRFC
jgi:CubicO group peptidase (beta-lactamase class C family)